MEVKRGGVRFAPARSYWPEVLAARLGATCPELRAVRPSPISPELRAAQLECTVGEVL